MVRMEIKLTPENEKLIERKLGTGQYRSANDVVREALHLLEAYDEAYQKKLTALRNEIERGIDSGPGIPADEAFQELWARIAARKKKRHRAA
jgi:antitoxin ParD1/3/4